MDRPRDVSGRNGTHRDEAASLSPRQVTALEVLVAGRGATAAAQAAGVSRSSVNRWIDGDPDFLAAYNSRRREVADATRQALDALAGDAIRVLRQALRSRQTPPAVRLRAAWQVASLAARDAAPIGPTNPAEARIELARRRQIQFLDEVAVDEFIGPGRGEDGDDQAGSAPG